MSQQKLYRAAALSECVRLQSGEDGVLRMLLLHALFPRLPAVEIRQWGILAQDRVWAYTSDRHAARVDLKWDLKDDELSERAKKEPRNGSREIDHTQKMDIEILRSSDRVSVSLSLSSLGSTT